MLRVACYCLGIASILADNLSGEPTAAESEQATPRFHTFPHVVTAEKGYYGHHAVPAEDCFTRIPAHAFGGEKYVVQDYLRF